MSHSRHLPTIEDVAREAGVSKTTAGAILSGVGWEKQAGKDTRDRVLDVARRIGYSRNSVGVALRRGYSDIVVILSVTWHMTRVYIDIATMIDEVASSHRLSTLVHLARNDEDAASFLRRVSSFKAYGLVLIWDSTAIPEGDIGGLLSSGLPVVDLMPYGTPGVVSVTADREQGIFDCTTHLVQLGHHKIGMIIDDECRWKSSRQKTLGYKRALDSARLEYDSDLVEKIVSMEFEAGREAAGRMLRRRPDTTAIVCQNDLVGLGAIAGANEMGLSVPGDVSVTGFGAEKEGSYFRPRLTTAKLPESWLAENAVRCLCRTREHPSEPSASASAPMELLVRESTGPCREQRA